MSSQEPHSIQQDGGSSDTVGRGGTLADTLESVVKISGILAVLGFISLRTHLALLGVSWDTSLGTEKYLVEAYQLVSASFAVILDYLPLIMKIGLNDKGRSHQQSYILGEGCHTESHEAQRGVQAFVR